MDRLPLLGYASIAALKDVEEFLADAQRLKALILQRSELRKRQSARERSLSVQIGALEQTCSEYAQRKPRLASLWLDTLGELRALEDESSVDPR
jgi:hypothetical protein